MGNKNILIKNNKGLSQVVTTVLLIALTIVLVAVIWGTINSFVGERLEDSSACYGLLEKIKLNNEWTCYNHTSKNMQFSIEIGDVDVQAILVSVSNEESSNTFKILNESSMVDNVFYMGQNSGEIKLPTKEGGRTYVLTNILQKPSSIKIAPIVNERQCDVIDTVETVYTC